MRLDQKEETNSATFQFPAATKKLSERLLLVIYQYPYEA